MTENLLEPIDRFHDECKALAAAGINIDLGIDGGGKQLAQGLDQIRSALRVRVSLGQSLEDAIAQDERLPARYRAAAQAWLAMDSPAAVLDAMTASTEVDRGVDRGIRLALSQTAMIMVLVCMGLAFSAVWLSPKIDAINAQLGVTPSASALWLSAARVWMPVWATAVTAVFLLVLLLWYHSGGNWISRWSLLLPMVRRRQDMIRHARFAEYLSRWLRNDLPLHDGIEFAAALSRDESVLETRPRLGEAEHGQAAADTPRARTLPPLLSWAVTGEPADEPRWSVLQSVAEIYRRLADRQVAAWTNLIPMIAAACLCGLAVMLYGLGVFLPVIELLNVVSAPEAYE